MNGGLSIGSQKAACRPFMTAWGKDSFSSSPSLDSCLALKRSVLIALQASRKGGSNLALSLYEHV